MPLGEGQDVGDRDLATELGGQRGDAGVGDAAGHEAVVPAQVDVAVEGEAVQATPRLTRMPMAATLRSGRPRPDVGSARSHTPLRPGTRAVSTPEVAADADQGLLEAAYVVDDLDVVGQRDDRVADQLAGTVEGDLAAAVDVDHRSAAGVGRPLVRARCACRP